MADEPVSPAPAVEGDPGPMESDAPTDTPGDTPWTAQFGTDVLRTDATIGRYKTLDEFGTGFLEQRKALSSQVKYPEADAAPEAWTEFYSKVPGFPTSADAYDVAPPEMPANVAMSADELTRTLQGFHQLNLTSTQAQGLLAMLAESNALRAQAQQAQDQAHIDTAHATLAQLPGWGPLTDHNLAVANEGIRREFPTAEWLDQILRVDDTGHVAPLRNMPEFVEMAYQFSLSKGHGKFVPGGANAGSVEQAQAAIAQAHVDRREGKITDTERNAVIKQHGPLAYSENAEGQDYARTGTTHGGVG